MAEAITSRPGFVAALVSTTSPVVVVIARSQDGALRVNDILGEPHEEPSGGRGGGKADLAQGGGLNAESLQTGARRPSRRLHCFRENRTSLTTTASMARSTADAQPRTTPQNYSR